MSEISDTSLRLVPTILPFILLISCGADKSSQQSKGQDNLEDELE